MVSFLILYNKTVHLQKPNRHGKKILTRNERSLSSENTILQKKDTSMKAIGSYRYLPIENEESLIDLEIEKPTPSGHDLLVHVKAISVNPT